jgi:T5SS/PEP-CTERM-associated repeat protein
VTGSGTVLNTTAGTQFQNIEVGKDGTASLTIQDQATVYTSNMQVAVDPQNGITDKLDVSNATLGVTQILIVGMGGSAAGTFEAGAKVTAAGLIIGRDSGSDGDLTVDNSKLTVTGAISIGDAGSGSLTIQDNATVSASTFIIAHQAGSVGELTIQSGDSMVNASADMIFAQLADSEAKLTVDGSNVSAANFLRIGVEGKATATIQKELSRSMLN